MVLCAEDEATKVRRIENEAGGDILHSLHHAENVEKLLEKDCRRLETKQRPLVYSTKQKLRTTAA